MTELASVSAAGASGAHLVSATAASSADLASATAAASGGTQETAAPGKASAVSISSAPEQKAGPHGAKGHASKVPDMKAMKGHFYHLKAIFFRI